MAITIIVAIVAVAVALLIAVPLTCKVAVNNKAKKDAEDKIEEGEANEEDLEEIAD